MKTSVTHIFKWKYSLIAIVVTAVLALSLSAPVRAKALDLIRIIAGFNVEERTESPLQGLDDGEAILPQETEPVTEKTDPTLVVIEPEVQSIPTAFPEGLENLPFDFALPGWLPDGFVLDSNIAIANSKSWVSMVWYNQNGAEIEMMVEQEYNGYNIPAGENSAEEIQINGQPALLVRGFWGNQHQWDSQRGLAIGWEKDGRFYRLSYFEREPEHNEITAIQGDMESIIQELIRMAESIQ